MSDPAVIASGISDLVAKTAELQPDGEAGDFVAASVTTGALSATTLNVSALPTEDPLVDGAIWADSGVLTLSAGPA